MHAGTKTSEKKRAVKLQINQLDARRDRLTDALLDEVIDDAEFKRRKASMLLERSHLDEQLEQVRQNRVSDEMIDAFFERLKSLANTYRDARPAKKRQIVSWATSNRTVEGRYLCLEPSDWLISTESALAGLGCGDAKATFRTSDTKRKLLEIILNQQS